MTGQVWVTAIRAHRRGQHAASRASWPNSSTAAGLPDRWCSSGPPSRVSTSVCSRPITLSSPRVSSSWMPPTKPTHMKCRGWRDLCRYCRRLVSFDFSACRSVRESNRCPRQCGATRRQRVSARRDTRRQLTKSFTFGRPCRKSEARGRKLTIPVVVVTGARGADENWRQLQQDLASLSERGCLMIARQSGHVVSVDQPEVVVDAIRRVVETARGHDVPLCATPPATGHGDTPRR